MRNRLLQLGMISVICLGSQTSILASPVIPVDEFVRKIFIHGVTFAKAKEYESIPSAITKLKQMLDTDCIPSGIKESPFCSNIVVTLGIIGGDDQDAVDKMQTFIVKENKNLSLPEFRAKTSGGISLGYVINKGCTTTPTTPNTPKTQCNPPATDALNFLKMRRWASDWDNVVNPITLDPSFPLKKEDLKDQLVRSTIIGLAVSGTSEALKLLNELLLNSHFYSNPSLRALIIEAIEANRVIADKGLVCYYNEESPGC